MYTKTLAFFAAAANDQQYWIEQSKQNAIRDLDKWPKAVDALVSDRNSKLVEYQILSFQSQVGNSVDNMKSFVPKLVSVVGYIDSIAASDPNFIRRGILHTILWFIKGKRDNKSYYLLDGAVNWVSYRVFELNSRGDHRATDLASKLTDVQVSVANLRDELDSAAQNYVKGVTKIQELSCDISKNIVEIRALANGLVTAFQNSPLLKNADKVNDSVEALVVSLKL